MDSSKPITKAQGLLRTQLIQDVIETCAVKGLQVKSNTLIESVEYNHAPISLFPTPFSAKLYQKAKDLQPHLGFMVADLVCQPDYIQDILKYFKEHDELMSKMLKVSEEFNKKPVDQRQNIHLCILRSDYMVDQPSDSLKLVEYNTVASSFGCLCQKVREVQGYVIDKYSDQLTFNYDKPYDSIDDGLGRTYIKDIGNVFKRVLEYYLQSQKKLFPDEYQSVQLKDLWVLFVVDREERNICDQKLIESEIYDSYGIKSMRRTFPQIGQEQQVDPKTNSLKINGREVAFVYYRTGYQLEQYEGEQDWKTRELLETTMPIKCPSIDVHLTTFKKFQQAFTDDKLLHQVMSQHPENAEQLNSLFKGLWTFEDIEKPGFSEVMQKAIDNPHDYVIKPQKEGGGHNIYNDDVRKMILETSPEDLKPYLLMERIRPPEIKAYMLRNGKLLEGLTLSELGIFSSVFIDTQLKQNGVIENQTFGRLLRTKGRDSDEGGVNAGYAVIDQPFILEIEDLKDQNREILPLVRDF